MSRIAKRPICGKALKASITRGFVGRILTRAASPVLRKSGFSAFGAPVFGSRAAMISSKVHATWAVWAWKTGVYPAVMTLGWFSTMICAVKDLATVGGFSVGPATSPRRRSFLSIPRMLKPTLSPGSACEICSWCISIDFTSPTLSAGMKWTFIPTFRRPDDEDGGIGLGRARDHVLDEVPVAGGVDDREVVLVRVKAFVRDVDR